MNTRLFTALLCLLCSVALAAETFEPSKAIDQFGAVTLNDGSSYFTFTKGGAFKSGPLQHSGRIMNGYWFRDENDNFVVIARLGWMNGAQGLDAAYRRIVFHISHVSKRVKKADVPIYPEPHFDGYFLIDEMTSISKPDKPIAAP